MKEKNNQNNLQLANSSIFSDYREKISSFCAPISCLVDHIQIFLSKKNGDGQGESVTLWICKDSKTHMVIALKLSVRCSPIDCFSFLKEIESKNLKYIVTDTSVIYKNAIKLLNESRKQKISHITLLDTNSPSHFDNDHCQAISKFLWTMKNKAEKNISAFKIKESFPTPFILHGDYCRNCGCDYGFTQEKYFFNLKSGLLKKELKCNICGNRQEESVGLLIAEDEDVYLFYEFPQYINNLVQQKFKPGIFIIANAYFVAEQNKFFLSIKRMINSNNESLALKKAITAFNVSINQLIEPMEVLRR